MALTEEQQERLELLLNSALRQFQKEHGSAAGKFVVRLSEESREPAVNDCADLQLEDDLSPDDFTPEQLREARRLYLYENYSDEAALKKVREEQDG